MTKFYRPSCPTKTETNQPITGSDKNVITRAFMELGKENSPFHNNGKILRKLEQGRDGNNSSPALAKHRPVTHTHNDSFTRQEATEDVDEGVTPFLQRPFPVLGVLDHSNA